MTPLGHCWLLACSIGLASAGTCMVDDHPHGAMGLLGWGTDQVPGRYLFSKPAESAGSEVQMLANPTSISSGDKVTMSWKDAGGYQPKSNDWFGWYCSSDVSTVADAGFVSWEYVIVDSGWATAGGKYELSLNPTTKSQCEFRLFNHEDGTSYFKIGTSNIIQVSSSDQPSKAEVTMSVSPAAIEQGGEVTLKWHDAGGYSPKSNDWIGYYCSEDLSKVVDTGFLDWVYVTDGSSWATGTASFAIVLQSARNPQCEFRMFNHEDGSSYFKIGVSNKVEIIGANSHVEQRHLALTGDNTEMLLQWTAAFKNAVVQFAPKGASWTSKGVKEVVGKCHTYKASDMCHAPATSAEHFVDPGQLCEALMVGLTPDGEYQYRISADGKSNFTDVSVFRAAPPVGPDYSFKYIVYGDMGTYGGSAGDQSFTTARLAAVEMEQGARMTHHFGDLGYARGYASIWDTWMNLIEPYAKVAPYMVGIGNHEFDYTSGGQHDPSGDPHFTPSWFNGGSDSGGECGVPSVKRFHMPAERSSGNGVFWHSYDFGSLHQIMLSSENDVCEGSTQKAWLAKDLSNVDRSRTPWVVVELHRPMYNNENYASDFKVAENFQKCFEDVLVKFDVDLVLAGHYHSYLRTKRVYKDKHDEDKGIVHITIGNAGASVDSATLYDKDWNDVFDKNYGYGRITIVNSTAMHWEHVRNKENHAAPVTVDELWIKKRSTVFV